MIRVQYHFRPSVHGLLAWDIRRLIELSKELPFRKIDISDIAEIEENHWYAHATNIPTCKSIAEHCLLINDADLSYPIILDQNGRVMDGMHRVCKALMKGLSQISAMQFSEDPEPDYVDCNPDSLPYDA